MRSFQFVKRSWQRVLPMTGAMLLLNLLLGLYALGTAPAMAQGEFIRVPDDAGSIQVAIDLAPPGGEIRVQGGGYFEHLVISKTLRLSGSWNSDFSVQDRNSPTILNGGGSGRAVTILGGEVAPSVVMSYFVFTGGAATGLGGVLTPTVPRATEPGVVRMAAPDVRSLAEQAAALRGQLIDLAAGGLFPGGQAALGALLQRVDAATVAAPALDAASTLSSAAAGVDGEIDCGGGIYINGAALHLINATLEDNLAGETNGAGGGLCAVNALAGGLVLEKVVFGKNVAGKTGTGFGGGLFFAGGDTPSASALHLNNVRISANVASLEGRGYGGGAFVADAPAAQLDLALFSSNYASGQGLAGYGGGLYLSDSSDVVMSRVGFENNTGVNVSYYTGDEWPIGSGGALLVSQSPNLLITSPQDGEADSLFIGNLAALRGAGIGGALAVADSPGLQIERTRFMGNWALVYPSGGGDAASGGAIDLVGSPGFRLRSSHFANNMVAVFNLDGDLLRGGALSINGADDIALTANSFESNSCGTSSGGGLAHGGAVGIIASDFVTVTGNTFTDNAADLGLSGGLGGALHLEQTSDVWVEHNRFERNRAGTGAGIGGALTVESNAAPGLFPPQDAAVAPQGIADKLNERLAIRANIFAANFAATELGGDQANLGGAIALNSVNGVEFANNVLGGNVARDGGALALMGWNRETITATVAAAGVVNNTLFNNEGESGVYLEGWTTPITLTNNIVVSHTVGIQVAASKATGSMAAEARYNLYNDNGTDNEVDPDSTLVETGKITGSVLFVEPWRGDFRLLPQSAAVDAGDLAGVPPAPAVDMDNTPRPFGPRVDAGAYEWHGPLHYNYLPGVLKEACHTPLVEGWAMGEDAQNRTTILHSADGGLTWSRQHTATLLLNGLTIGDRLHLWSTGDSATILHSADGGATWQKQPPPAALPATASIGRITAVDANTAWAAAKSGDGANNTAYVINTTDGGATWTVQTSFATGPGWINWIDAADANNIWASGGTSPALLGQRTGAGGNGYIYHSADGGRTWRLELETSNGPVIGIDAVSATVAWAAGRFGAYRTLDGGTTWEFFNLVALADLNHVDSIGGQQVWVSGDSFTVLYTDRGLTQPLPNNAWQNRTPAQLQNKVAYTVDFIDAKNGWIAGGAFGANPSGVIARTCDGGITWEASEWQDLDTIRSVQMIPPAN